MDGFRRVIVAALVAAAGCEHKVEPPSGMAPLGTGGPPPSTPTVATHPATGANAPGVAGGELPEGHPTMPGGHPTMPGGHPTMPPGHPAMGDPNGGITGETPSGDFDPQATVTGVLTLSDKIKDQVKPGEVIFLVARQDDGTDKGTILAVKRLTVGAWPQPFQLDGSAPMFPGTKFAGKVLLTARVDKDGDAITKNPGDALGVLHVEVPSSGVKLNIDTITR